MKSHGWFGDKPHKNTMKSKERRIMIDACASKDTERKESVCGFIQDLLATMNKITFYGLHLISSTDSIEACSHSHILLARQRSTTEQLKADRQARN